jgi:hypothetical protein
VTLVATIDSQGLDRHNSGDLIDGVTGGRIAQHDFDQRNLEAAAFCRLEMTLQQEAAACLAQPVSRAPLPDRVAEAAGHGQ